MCRLAAFPPNFPRERALDILLEFEGQNVDGVGSAYLKDGKFIVDKYPKSLTEILNEGHEFLGHMPNHNGWTIAHLRLASHGENETRNTHPFIVGAGNREAGEGEWCIAHNGVWSDYSVVKLALKKYVKFYGETDTEVAAELINLVGPKEFSDEITFGGVFLCLNKTGELFAVKTSGDLDCFHRTNKTIVLASALNKQKFQRRYEHERGWYHYSKEGKYIAHEHKKPSYYSYSGFSYGDNSSCNMPTTSKKSSSLIGAPNGREWQRKLPYYREHENDADSDIPYWAYHD